MQVVDELRHVGHVDLFGVAVEGVERERRHEGVAQGAHLLEEVALVDLGPFGMPASPLVDDELHAVLGVELRPEPPIGR